MIRYPGRLEAVDEPAELAEIGLAQRIGRADRQRHAVQHERGQRPGVFENPQGPPATDYEVLRDRLEPVDPGAAVEHARIVGGPQSNPVTEIGDDARHSPLSSIAGRESRARSPGTLRTTSTSSTRSPCHPA